MAIIGASECERQLIGLCLHKTLIARGSGEQVFHPALEWQNIEKCHVASPGEKPYTLPP